MTHDEVMREIAEKFDKLSQGEQVSLKAMIAMHATARCVSDPAIREDIFRCVYSFIFTAAQLLLLELLIDNQDKISDMSLKGSYNRAVDAITQHEQRLANFSVLFYDSH